MVGAMRAGLALLLFGAPACGARSRSAADSAPDGGVTDEDAGPCASPDRDGDGHRSIRCGGDDCDDADSAAHPGAVEAPGEDRDCDGASGIDADVDGFAGTSTGGDDCDDADGSVHPGAPEAHSWQVEPLADIETGPVYSVAVSPDDDEVVIAMHIEDGLAVGQEDGTDWQWEVAVPDDEWFLDGTLEIDPSGIRHLFYWRTPTALWYAADASGDWAREPIDEAAGAVTPWAAVDSRGTPHVVYDGGAKDARYATLDGASWTVETIESFGCSDGLALDGEGRPHVAFYGQVGGTWGEHIATRQDWGWSTELLGSCPSDLDLVFGGDGALRAVCEFGALFIFRGRDGWESEPVSAGTDGDGGASLALDRLDVERVAYFDEDGDIRYAEHRGGEWTTEPIPGAEAMATLWQETSIALDSGGRPHVVFTWSRWRQPFYARPVADGVDANCDGLDW